MQKSPRGVNRTGFGRDSAIWEIRIAGTICHVRGGCMTPEQASPRRLDGEPTHQRSCQQKRRPKAPSRYSDCYPLQSARCVPFYPGRESRQVLVQEATRGFIGDIAMIVKELVHATDIGLGLLQHRDIQEHQRLA